MTGSSCIGHKYLDPYVTGALFEIDLQPVLIRTAQRKWYQSIARMRIVWGSRNMAEIATRIRPQFMEHLLTGGSIQNVNILTYHQGTMENIVNYLTRHRDLWAYISPLGSVGIQFNVSPPRSIGVYINLTFHYHDLWVCILPPESIVHINHSPLSQSTGIYFTTRFYSD